MTRVEKTRAEHRRVLNQIEHAKAKREAGFKMIARAEAAIPKLERTAERVHRKLKRQVAEELAPKAVAPKPKPPASSDVTDIPLSELGMTAHGQANKKSWVRAVARGGSKTRRTPDDFAADIKKKTAGKPAA